MKNINPKINTSIAKKAKNNDALALKFEKTKGLCVMADGKESGGAFSAEWANYLCQKTPFTPIKTLKGFKKFTNTIWEEFYEDNKKSIKDSFQLRTFEKHGSFATYAACWFSQKKERTFYQWLSYGNSPIMVYNKKTDELLVPEYGDSILGFLQNKGLVNWKDDNLEAQYLQLGQEQEFHQDIQIILASDAMAEHLALSYLIIKSKDDDYWEQLSTIMQSDEQLANLIFNNRNSYQFNSFQEVLDKWETETKTGNIAPYVKLLQKEKKLAVDDISFQLIAHDSTVPDLITSHQPIVLKTYPEPATKAIIIRPPKPIITTPRPKVVKIPEFKQNANAFMDVILDHKISKLYHFTDRSNISSIKKLGGLYSWDYMLSNNLDISCAGGDSLSRMLDARYGLEDYVRTSFCSNHPMMYIAQNSDRIIDPVILEINPEIVTLYHSRFCNMNATKKGHSQGKGLSDLQRIKFDICLHSRYYHLSADDKSYYQAEVMVRKFIPAKYIMNLNSF